MSARSLRHISTVGDVDSARQTGATIRVLCGRIVRPLAEAELSKLPICPRCQERRAQLPTLTASTGSYYLWTISFPSAAGAA
jgi:hypothetical protein